MRAGLEASTVTPGKTPPEASFTTPVIDACAYAETDEMTRHAKTVRTTSANLLGGAVIVFFSFPVLFVLLWSSKNLREDGGDDESLAHGTPPTQDHCRCGLQRS
jgi:hypothetical protein